MKGNESEKSHSVLLDVFEIFEQVGGGQGGENNDELFDFSVCFQW